MRQISCFLLILFLASLAGCGVTPHPGATARPVELIAPYSYKPIVVDGNLDDPVWQTATVYHMAALPPFKLTETATIRMAWDDRFVYLAAQIIDSDVMAEGTQDGMLHYDYGDVLELFLKPEDRYGYWECYVTPRGNQSAFYFPGCGRRPLKVFIPAGRIQVAAQVQGTLNDYSDRDRGWTAEMAIPIELFARENVRIGPGTSWRVLVGRYNFSRYLAQEQLSSFPAVSATSFHLLDEYAILKFIK